MKNGSRVDAIREAVGRWWRGEAGAAAVEFALVLPILVVLLFGIVEFGRAWSIHHLITDASREAARRAVVKDGQNKAVTVPDVIQARLASAGLSWNQSLASYEADCEAWAMAAGSAGAVVVSGCGWGGATGTEAHVVIRVPVPFDILRPLLKLLGGNSATNPVTLTTNFVMRNE
jgi:Flp pilus assembly protein TadG